VANAQRHSAHPRDWDDGAAGRTERASGTFADHAYVLERGSITMEGTGAELLAREDLKAAYLGL